MATLLLTEEFVRQYWQVFLIEAFRLLHNWHDAEDAAQEAFLKVYQSRGQFRGEHLGALVLWVRRIVQNQGLNDLTKKERERKKRKKIDLDSYLPKHESSPGKEMEDSEVKEKLDAAIRRLRPDRRTAVLDRLRDNESCSLHQVTRNNCDKCRNLLYSAKKDLGKSLARYSSLDFA